MKSDCNTMRMKMMACVDIFGPAGNLKERHKIIDTGCTRTDTELADRYGLFSEASNTALDVGTGVTVRHAVGQYVAEIEGKRKKTEKTNRENRSILYLFADLVEYVAGSEVLCSAIDRATASRVRDALKILPKNISRSAKYRDSSLEEILTNGVPEADRIDETTVKKYMTRINGFGDWCVVADHMGKNYFKGLIAGNRKRRASDEREVYRASEMRLIFGPEGAGQSKYFSAYWLPIMGLYTGARLNELSQLRVEDFIRVDGLPCVQIVEDSKGMRIKNENSRRLIPLHPELLRLGLMEFVENRRSAVTGSAGGNLFECNWDKNNGFGKNSGRRFSVLLTRLGIKKPGKSFHSLRHTFIDSLKQAGVSEGVVAAIAGHEHGGITFSRYGKDFKPAVLIEALEKLSYDVEVAGMPDGLNLG